VTSQVSSWLERLPYVGSRKGTGQWTLVLIGSPGMDWNQFHRSVDLTHFRPSCHLLVCLVIMWVFSSSIMSHGDPEGTETLCNISLLFPL
jgi:hypothetical protein